MGFFCQLAVFFLFVGCVDGSCLSLLTGDQCSTIQDAGQQLAKLLKKANIALQEFSDRCMDNSMKIIVSTMKGLKKEAKKVNLVNSRITVIETASFTSLSAVFKLQIKLAIRTSNSKFWGIIQNITKNYMANDVARILLFDQPRAKRSTPTEASVTELPLEAIKNDLDQVLQLLENTLKHFSKSLYTMFSNSLKMLIQGKIRLDIKKRRTKIQKYLFDSFHGSLNTTANTISLLLGQAVQVIETIDNIVEPYKKGPSQLQTVLEPAVILTRERVQQILTQKPGAVVKFQQLANLLKKTCIDIRYNR